MNRKAPQAERVATEAPSRLRTAERVATEAPSRLSTAALLARIAQDAQGLVKAEVELAKTEFRADLQNALGALKRVGAAVAFGVAALCMLLVTIVLALAVVLPAWAAGLIVTVLLFAVAGIAGALAWRRRGQRPLARTRQNLKEDLRWRQKVA